MPEVTPPDGELEIARDEQFQRRTWTWQRVGRILLVLLLVAAVLGAFGPGIFNRATLGAEGAAWRMEYPRTGRINSAFNLTVRLDPEATRTGTTRLWLGQGYLDDVVVETVHPRPANMELAAGGVVYTFPTTTPGQPGTVTLEVRAQRFGSLAGEVGLEGQTPQRFRQFIYP